MSSETESFGFSASAESLLDSMLSAIDKPMEFGQSTEPAVKDDEAMSETSDFELIDLIEAHMEGYASSSPTESPLDGSVFEHVPNNSATTESQVLVEIERGAETEEGLDDPGDLTMHELHAQFDSKMDLYEADRASLAREDLREDLSEAQPEIEVSETSYAEGVLPADEPIDEPVDERAIEAADGPDTPVEHDIATGEGAIEAAAAPADEEITTAPGEKSSDLPASTDDVVETEKETAPPALAADEVLDTPTTTEVPTIIQDYSEPKSDESILEEESPVTPPAAQLESDAGDDVEVETNDQETELIEQPVEVSEQFEETAIQADKDEEQEEVESEDTAPPQDPEVLVKSDEAEDLAEPEIAVYSEEADDLAEPEVPAQSEVADAIAEPKVPVQSEVEPEVLVNSEEADETAEPEIAGQSEVAGAIAEPEVPVQSEADDLAEIGHKLPQAIHKPEVPAALQVVEPVSDIAEAEQTKTVHEAAAVRSGSEVGTDEAMAEEHDSQAKELTESPSVPEVTDNSEKVYLYTSFTGGTLMGRNMNTMTNSLKLILKANQIDFEIVDVASNEAARKLWGRGSKGKLLPGIVKGKDVVGNYEDLEDANEFGEVRQLILEFV